MTFLLLVKRNSDSAKSNVQKRLVAGEHSNTSGPCWDFVRVFAAIVLTCGLLPTSQVLAQGRSDTIVAEGDATPLGNGQFIVLTRLVFNDNGDVAFSGLYTPNGGGNENFAGVYYYSNGVTSELLSEGQAAPDSNGVFEGGPFFNIFSMNNSGQVGFYSSLDNTSGGFFDDTGIFLADTNGVTQIGREGQPTQIGTDTFASFSPNTPIHVNDSGDVMFEANYNRVGSPSNNGIFLSSGGVISQIVGTGQQAPDGNGFFSSVFFERDSAVNENGQLAFESNLIGTSGGDSDNHGVFIGSTSGVQQLAREGQLAPGGGIFTTFQFPVINNSGDAVFFGQTTTGSGLFMGDGEDLKAIVRSGQVAPGGTNLFSTISDRVVLNNSGQVAFFSTLTASNRGLFRYEGSSITEIARDGYVPPDGNGIFSSFDDPLMNDAGQLAFVGYMNGTTGGNSDNRGLYTSDGIDFIKVVRRGEEIAGSNVVNIGLAGLNENGQILYLALLADGGSAIRRWTPDLNWREPGSGEWDNGKNWTLSLNPAFVHDVFIAPDTSATITGAAEDVTVRSLQIGGGAGDAMLRLQSGSVLTAINGVSIETNGTLAGHGEIVGVVTNNGTIAPGSSAGELTFDGDLALTDTSVVQIEIGGLTLGTEYDSISVTGELQLDGLLEISFIDGFESSITSSDVFTIFSAGTLTGTFANTVVHTSNGMGFFHISYNSNGLVLSNFTAVPEPGTTTLLFVFSICLAVRRHRKNTTCQIG